MRVAYNDKDDRAGSRGMWHLIKHTHSHTHLVVNLKKKSLNAS